MQKDSLSYLCHKDMLLVGPKHVIMSQYCSGYVCQLNISQL